MPSTRYPPESVVRNFYDHLMPLPNGHIQWCGAKRKGYNGLMFGVIRHKTDAWYVSRLAWLQGRHEQIGQYVWAICNHSECLNPEHLMTGSGSEMRAWLAHNGRTNHLGRPKIDDREAERTVQDAFEHLDENLIAVSNRHSISQAQLSRLITGKSRHNMVHRYPARRNRPTKSKENATHANQ